MKSKHFRGDIIITDPCYVIKSEDWINVCEHLKNPDYEILPGAIYHDACGDWSCKTYDAETKKTIGCFCADAGLVAVFNLAEVLKYNPNFDDHITKKYTTTLVKDFDGDVWFENVRHHDGVSVRVVGKGTNIETGEAISFFTEEDDDSEGAEE